MRRSASPSRETHPEWGQNSAPLETDGARCSILTKSAPHWNNYCVETKTSPLNMQRTSFGTCSFSFPSPLFTTSIRSRSSPIAVCSSRNFSPPTPFAPSTVTRGMYLTEWMSWQPKMTQTYTANQSSRKPFVYYSVQQAECTSEFSEVALFRRLTVSSVAIHTSNDKMKLRCRQEP